MKTFCISLKYIAYANYEIEAANPEDAEAQAWDEVRADSDHAISYGEWTTESVEELQDDPETETGDDLAQFYGPSAR